MNSVKIPLIASALALALSTGAYAAHGGGMGTNGGVGRPVLPPAARSPVMGTQSNVPGAAHNGMMRPSSAEPVTGTRIRPPTPTSSPAIPQFDPPGFGRPAPSPATPSPSVGGGQPASTSASPSMTSARPAIASPTASVDPTQPTATSPSPSFSGPQLDPPGHRGTPTPTSPSPVFSGPQLDPPTDPR